MFIQVIFVVITPPFFGDDRESYLFRLKLERIISGPFSVTTYGIDQFISTGTIQHKPSGVPFFFSTVLYVKEKKAAVTTVIYSTLWDDVLIYGANEQWSTTVFDECIIQL